MYQDSEYYGVPDWFYDEHVDCELGTDHSSGRIEPDQIIGFAHLLKEDPDESDIQLYMQKHKELFMSFMRTGHGNWVFVQPSLGNHFRPDFLWAEGSSGGLSWCPIELESPRHTPFLKDGRFRGCLNKAIDQIRDWREYILDNGDFIRKQKSSGGLGFHQIRPRSRAIIYIGRRHERYPVRYQNLRHEMAENQNIEIKSYDSLLESLTVYWERVRNRNGRASLSFDY